MSNIILASQSPRRKQLLELAEVDFTVMVSDSDESFPEGMSVNEVPVYVAEQKAKVILSQASDKNIIIAADTIVVVDDEIIGKPKDREEAISHLSKLSGKIHHVITGVFVGNSERQEMYAETTEVEFNSLTNEQIEYYVDKYKPYDKAGAYAIQEWIGVVGIRKINGDYYNVMGLPISRVLNSLRILSEI